MPSELDLDRLSELEAKATPGPWEILNLADYWEIVQEGDGYDACHNLFDEDQSNNAKDNAELLAALRNAAKPLIAAAREAETLRVLLRRAYLDLDRDNCDVLAKEIAAAIAPTD